MLTWLPFSADSAAMVCSAQKVKVAVKSAKIGASSHVTNSILKNATKWFVYASTVTNTHNNEKFLVKIKTIPVAFSYEQSDLVSLNEHVVRKTQCVTYQFFRSVRV